MSSPPECAALLRRYLADVDVRVEAELYFKNRLVLRVAYSTKQKLKGAGSKPDAPAPHEPNPEEAGDDEPPSKKQKKDRRRDSKKDKGKKEGREKTPERPPQPTTPPPAPAPAPAGAAGGDIAAPQLVGLSGYCLFHLAYLCKIPSKDGTKLIECFNKGDVCRHGRHAAPSAATAASIADMLQASRDGGAQRIKMAPPVIAALITKLRSFPHGA
jgi:hypothetical protein